MMKFLQFYAGGYRTDQPQQIKKYFETYYRPNNMSISISGEIDYNETIKFINDKSLKTILKSYLKFKKLDSNWNYINSCSNLDLTNQLSMICPFSTHEKQMLLESKSIDDRYILLLSILENTVKLNEEENQIRH